MSYVVWRRVAYREEVRCTAPTQAQLIHRAFRQSCQVAVREGTDFPLIVERLVGLIAACFAAKNVRERGLPALRDLGAESFFVIQVCALGQRESPGFFVIRLHRMGLHKIFDKRHGTIRA